MRKPTQPTASQTDGRIKILTRMRSYYRMNRLIHKNLPLWLLNYKYEYEQRKKKANNIKEFMRIWSKNNANEWMKPKTNERQKERNKWGNNKNDDNVTEKGYYPLVLSMAKLWWICWYYISCTIAMAERMCVQYLQRLVCNGHVCVSH